MIEFYTREIQNGRENRPILNRFKEKTVESTSLLPYV
jgi:hypothetical protein